MNFANLMRHGVWGVVGAAGAFAAFGSTTVALSACGDSSSCTRLRTDTYALKQTWGACDPAAAEPCIFVLGNSKDCTGVLTCEFAVNPIHRVEAEEEVLTIAGRSQGCYLCATPTCVDGEIPWCEPITRQCLLVSGFTDGGVALSAEPPVDAGPPPVILEAGPTPTPIPEAGPDL
jgi:hypothetical protein